MTSTPSNTSFNSIEDIYGESDSVYELDREVDKYREQHRECPHSDSEAAYYLYHELGYFRKRDVIIRDVQGRFLAGLKSSLLVSVATIYRWLRLVYTPIDGWHLVRTSDGAILKDSATELIEAGDYHVLSTSTELVTLRKVAQTIPVRSNMGKDAPKNNIELKFARNVMKRDLGDLVFGPQYWFETLDKPDGRTPNPEGWVYIYPVSWYDEWITRLPECDRADHVKVRHHLERLLDLTNGMSIPKIMINDFMQYSWGVDVLDNHRLVDFVGYNIDMIPPESGDRLRLDCIQDPSELPSQELLGEHFKICLLRFFAGEVDMDMAEASRHASLLSNPDASIDLSDLCWTKGPGKEMLEHHISSKLFGALLSDLQTDGNVLGRWLRPYKFIEEGIEDKASLDQILTWPETFDSDSPGYSLGSSFEDLPTAVESVSNQDYTKHCRIITPPNQSKGHGVAHIDLSTPTDLPDPSANPSAESKMHLSWLLNPEPSADSL